MKHLIGCMKQFIKEKERKRKFGPLKIKKQNLKKISSLHPYKFENSNFFLQFKIFSFNSEFCNLETFEMI